MMTTRSNASIALLMRVDDTTGRQIEIERDVLRRSYIALLGLAREIYAHHRPPDRFPEESLSMSFFEPAPGEVLFEAEVVVDRHPRAARPLVPVAPGEAQIADSADRALQRTGETLVELVRTYAFVLSSPKAIREGHPDGADYTDEDTGRRLRVSGFVDRGLVGGDFDLRVRELLWALTRQGVGAFSLTAGGRLQRSQIHHMVVASDQVVDFLRGAQLPHPIDRAALGSSTPAAGAAG